MKGGVVLTAIGIAVIGASLGAQSVVRKFDRFQRYTTFGVPSVVVLGDSATAGHAITMDAFYGCDGDVSSCRAGEGVELLFTQSNDDWEYLRDHNFTFLLDGKSRLDAGTRGYDGTVGNGYVMESQAVHLTASQFKRLAAATTVEAQWGSMEFKFSPDALAAIRVLAASIRAASTTH